MSATIYFGSTPSPTQAVNADLLAKGIRLIRAIPGELNIRGTRNFDHDNYSFYLAHFPLFVKSAIEKKTVETSDTGSYYACPSTTLPSFLRDPQIIFQLPAPVSNDTIDNVKAGFNAREATARGRPALVATLPMTKVIELIKTFNPDDDTSYSVSSMNIQSYRAYVKLWTVIHSILKVHQYPLVNGSNTNTSGMIENWIAFDVSTYQKDAKELVTCSV
jgi:hypothetical protein